MFATLAFGPSETFQFDRNEDWAVLAGMRTKLQVDHSKRQPTFQTMIKLAGALGCTASKPVPDAESFLNSDEL